MRKKQKNDNFLRQFIISFIKIKIKGAAEIKV